MSPSLLLAEAVVQVWRGHLEVYPRPLTPHCCPTAEPRVAGWLQAFFSPKELYSLWPSATSQERLVGGCCLPPPSQSKLLQARLLQLGLTTEFLSMLPERWKDLWAFVMLASTQPTETSET